MSVRSEMIQAARENGTVHVRTGTPVHPSYNVEGGARALARQRAFLRTNPDYRPANAYGSPGAMKLVDTSVGFDGETIESYEVRAFGPAPLNSFTRNGLALRRDEWANASWYEHYRV